MKTKQKKLKRVARCVCQFFVAGLVYYDYLSATIRQSDKVSLVAEPENPHDSSAIKVIINGVHVGYVPRDANQQILSLGDTLDRAVVKNYEPANATHRRVLVEIFAWDVAPEVLNKLC